MRYVGGMGTVSVAGSAGALVHGGPRIVLAVLARAQNPEGFGEGMHRDLLGTLSREPMRGGQGQGEEGPGGGSHPRQCGLGRGGP